MHANHCDLPAQELRVNSCHNAPSRPPLLQLVSRVLPEQAGNPADFHHRRSAINCGVGIWPVR
jgi:hypothetical protein